MGPGDHSVANEPFLSALTHVVVIHIDMSSGDWSKTGSIVHAYATILRFAVELKGSLPLPLWMGIIRPS